MPVGPPFNFKSTREFAPAIRVALLQYELSRLSEMKLPKVNAQVEKTFVEESVKAGAIHRLMDQPDPTKYGFMVLQNCGRNKTSLIVEDTKRSGDHRWGKYGEHYLTLHYADVTPELEAAAEVVSSNPETARLIAYFFFELYRRQSRLRDWRPGSKKAFKEWQNAGSSWHFRCGEHNVVLDFQGKVTEHVVIVEPKRRLRGLKK